MVKRCLYSKGIFIEKLDPRHVIAFSLKENYYKHPPKNGVFLFSII